MPSELETLLGYTFRDASLLETALTHRSFRNEQNGVEGADNQRLEFLGDAALGLVAAAWLFARDATAPEGALTDRRSRLISGEALAVAARRLELGRHLRLGRGEEQSGGRNRATSLADALEALLGAVFLDGGLDPVRAVFERHLAEPAQAADGSGAGNPKGTLQEWAQRVDRGLPEYRLIAAEGPEHARWYRVEVWLGAARLGEGEGPSRKAAETAAAAAALERLPREPTGA